MVAPMQRLSLPLLATAALFVSCGGTPSPASSEPTVSEAATTAPAPVETGYVMPDGPTPPMYKPSSKSPAPMPITDPAYGAFKYAPDAPTLGDTLPDFEVALADGGTFALAEARKAGPVLIMFYRGFW